MRRRIVRVLVLALVASATLAAGPGRQGIPCRGDPRHARQLTITVDGEEATGLFAVPARAPRGLVVFAHGYGHTAESWRHHLVRVATEDGVVAVAMDYRGTEIVPPEERGDLPSSRGWQVAEGAADSIAAAQLFDRRCPSIDTVVMYGVSMGGNASGLAVAEGATRSDGTTPLFDHWVDVEGAANVVETYHEARTVAATGNGFARNAQKDIERQMGGTFEEVPDVYLERTVVNRVPEIAGSGVAGVVVVHGVDDGLVPYDQSQELVQLLRRAGVPTEFHTVLRRGERSEPGTTLTGTFLGPTGVYESPFAGHASEVSTTHTVGVTGFRILSELLDGREVACADHVVDGDGEPAPAVPAVC